MAVRPMRKAATSKSTTTIGPQTGAFAGIAQDGPARKQRPLALAEELCARGCQFIENGIFDEAEREFRKALKMAPQYPEAYNNLGLSLLFQDKPDDACEALEEALRQLPGWSIAEANLGLALQRREKHDEAAHYFKQALVHKPQQPQVSLSLGEALAAAQRADDALGAYQTAVDQAPSYALAHFRIGTLQARRGKINEAENALLRVTQLDPSNAEALALLGAIAARRGNFTVAHEYFGRIDAEPAPVSAQRGRERLAAMNQAAEQGLAAYAALHGDPRPLSECYFDLGLALLHADRRAEARDAFRKASQCEPERAEFQIFSAFCLMLDGSAMEARHAWEKATQLDPGNGVPLEQLGYLALGMGLMREAAASFKRAAELGREIPPEYLQEA